MLELSKAAWLASSRPGAEAMTELLVIILHCLSTCGYTSGIREGFIAAKNVTEFMLILLTARWPRSQVTRCWDRERTSSEKPAVPEDGRLASKEPA